MTRFIATAAASAVIALIPLQPVAAQNNVLGGAVVGGAAGAVIGSAATGKAGGAVAGGVIGAARPARCSVRNCRHGRVAIIGTTTVAGSVTATAATPESRVVTATEIRARKKGGLAAAQVKTPRGRNLITGRLPPAHVTICRHESVMGELIRQSDFSKM